MLKVDFLKNDKKPTSYDNQILIKKKREEMVDKHHLSSYITCK